MENPDEKSNSLNKKYTASKTKEYEKNYINKKMMGISKRKYNKMKMLT